MIGYFLGRIYLFMISLGIKKEMIRFRQHLSGEMAHYACDCWDTELLCSYGWVECVGLADRSAYDLTQHEKGSGSNLKASRKLSKKVTKKLLTYKINKKEIAKQFKKETGVVLKLIDSLNDESVRKIQIDF